MVSQVGLIVVVCVALVAGQTAITIDPTVVYNSSFAKQCGEIRTPELVVGPKGVLLLGQCRSGGSDPAQADNLQDDMRHVRIVLSSLDGSSWTDPSFLTPVAHSVAVGIYDVVRDSVVVQYQNFTSSDPYKGNRLLQVKSTDFGSTWTEPVDITHFLDARGCNSAHDGMMCGAAGTRLQTSNGRLLFGGHNAGQLCVWFSDDGGDSYDTTEPIVGNEFSLAQLANGSVYMNGRGTQQAWKGNRTSWISNDFGSTFSAPSPVAIVEPNTFGCDGALATATVGDVDLLVFSEPSGPKERISFTLWCSTDAGDTWKSLVVNPGKVAAYSALAFVEVTKQSAKLLAVWEQRPNMLSHTFDMDWCIPKVTKQ